MRKGRDKYGRQQAYLNCIPVGLLLSHIISFFALSFLSVFGEYFGCELVASRLYALLSPYFSRLSQRILNIHPSLLPSFPLEARGRRSNRREFSGARFISWIENLERAIWRRHRACARRRHGRSAFRRILPRAPHLRGAVRLILSGRYRIEGRV